MFSVFPELYTEEKWQMSKAKQGLSITGNVESN